MLKPGRFWIGKTQSRMMLHEGMFPQMFGGRGKCGDSSWRSEWQLKQKQVLRCAQDDNLEQKQVLRCAQDDNLEQKQVLRLRAAGSAQDDNSCREVEAD